MITIENYKEDMYLHLSEVLTESELEKIKYFKNLYFDLKTRQLFPDPTINSILVSEGLVNDYNFTKSSIIQDLMDQHLKDNYYLFLCSPVIIDKISIDNYVKEFKNNFSSWDQYSDPHIQVLNLIFSYFKVEICDMVFELNIGESYLNKNNKDYYKNYLLKKDYSYLNLNRSEDGYTIQKIANSMKNKCDSMTFINKVISDSGEVNKTMIEYFLMYFGEGFEYDEKIGKIVKLY